MKKINKDPDAEKSFWESLINGENAIELIHQQRQERATERGKAVWAALQSSAKDRPETHRIEIVSSGIPVDPYYFPDFEEEDECGE